MSCCGEELLPFVTLWTESGLGAMGRKENSEQVAVRAGVRWLVGWRGRNLRPRFSPKILEFLPSIRFRWKKHPSKSSSNLPHTSPPHVHVSAHCAVPPQTLSYSDNESPAARCRRTHEPGLCAPKPLQRGSQNLGETGGRTHLQQRESVLESVSPSDSRLACD